MAHNITINYNSASALRSFLKREGLGMQKKFGQNFLINPAVRQALTEALHAETEVWEIGSGLGAMTSILLDNGFNVKAFEIDAGFIRVLKKIFADDKGFEIVEGDCLKTWDTQKPARFLLGNLPYNIAAVLLADLIEKNCIFERMVVTVQKEVAQRMAAKAGSKNYSSFSVLCSSAYNIKPLMTIRPSSFYPRPNVDSMGVLLESNLKKKTAKPPLFYKLVRSLFSSKRKTLKNNLAAFVALNIEEFLPYTEKVEIIDTLLFENKLSGNERAEELEIDVFLSLANSIENMRKYKMDVNRR
jgi:16S rRNA (adenine1518-N6/adenine1519-N6)-dimethyltransferase